MSDEGNASGPWFGIGVVAGALVGLGLALLAAPRRQAAVVPSPGEPSEAGRPVSDGLRDGGPQPGGLG